jgi:hypothetical protein
MISRKKEGCIHDRRQGVEDELTVKGNVMCPGVGKT